MCSGRSWSLLFLLLSLPWADRQQLEPCILCNGLYICRVSYFNHQHGSRNWCFRMKLKLESGYRVCMRKHIWIPVEKVLGSCIWNTSGQVLSMGSLSWSHKCFGSSQAIEKSFFSGDCFRDTWFEEVFHNSTIISDSSFKMLLSHKWCIRFWWCRCTITPLNATELSVHGNKIHVLICALNLLAIKSCMECYVHSRDFSSCAVAPSEEIYLLLSLISVPHTLSSLLH